MTTEVRQYLWLRLTILGSGAALLSALIVASIQLWPIVQRMMVPTKLACGCAIVSISTPRWLTTISTLIVLGTIGLMIWSVALFVMHLHRSRQQERRLREDAVKVVVHQPSNILVTIVDSPKTFAMTVGFWQPTMYVSQGLLTALTEEEFGAVVAHEHAHQRAYDPLLTVLMNIVSTVFRFVPGARDWMSSVYSLREVAADAVATDGYRTTDALSSAFVKLSMTSIHPSISAFSPNRDRLEKLLNHHWVSPRRWWSWVGALVVAIVIAGALSFSHFAVAESPAVPPAAAAVCQETMVMCRIEHRPELPVGLLCMDGQCVTRLQLWSPFYDFTPER